MTDPTTSRAGSAAPASGRAAAAPPGSAAGSAPAAWLGLALLAALSAALSLLVVGSEIWLDDPYIGFRYGANLARGLGLVYNAGEQVEGYTAWLWVMFAWVAAELDVDPLRFSQWINVASQMATLFVLFRFGRHGPRGRNPLCSLVAPALVALHLANVSWSMLGLETNFLMLLVTGAVLLLMRDAQRTTAGSLALGALLLLVALTRFDGLILAGVVMAYAVLIDRRIVQSIPATLVLAVGLGAFNLWRFAYYGHPFPNTFYAKQSTFAQEVQGGLRYVYHFFRDGGPYALVLLGLPFLAWSRRFDRGIAVAAWTTAGHLGYVAVIGGDWMVDYRFILPVLPLLAFLLQESLWTALERWAPAAGARRFAAAAAILALLLWNVQPLYGSRWANGQYRAKRPDAFWNAAEAASIGRHLDRVLPADALVAVEWAGIIPYSMRQPVFDIFGLNDADIMLQDFPGSRMGRAITPEYLVQRDPQAVVVVAVLFDTPEAARAGIDLRPAPSWIDTFYDTLREPHGYEVAVTKVAEGAYFPFLIQPGVPWKERVEAGLE